MNYRTFRRLKASELYLAVYNLNVKFPTVLYTKVIVMNLFTDFFFLYSNFLLAC